MQVCDNFKPAVITSDWICLFVCFIAVPFLQFSDFFLRAARSIWRSVLHSSFLAFEFRLLKKIKYSLNLLSTFSSSIFQLWETCSHLNQSLCLLITWFFFLTNFCLFCRCWSAIQRLCAKEEANIWRQKEKEAAAARK